MLKIKLKYIHIKYLKQWKKVFMHNKMVLKMKILKNINKHVLHLIKVVNGYHLNHLLLIVMENQLIVINVNCIYI